MYELEEAFNHHSVDWKEFNSCKAKFEFEVNDQKFYGVFEVEDLGSRTWTFFFYARHNGDISTGTTHRQGPSSTKVFGYVVTAIEEFLRRNTPNKLTFSGYKENGKAGLYTIMAKKLRPRLNMLGYTVYKENPVTNDEANSDYFTIEKLSPVD